MLRARKTLYILIGLFFTSTGFSQEGSSKLEGTGATDEYVASSTKLDFNDTLIEGKMKAPDGFMLSGRQSQSLTQMVKLRSNFRNELKNSSSAINALVK
jgi:hypothetical protein